MTSESTNKINLNTEEMAKAGVNFGHTVSKLHPKMKDYVAGIKNNVHMIDLEKSKEELEKALNFIANLSKDNKVILFVGTKIQIKEIVRKTAEICKMPYVTERWLGGTFTNFDTILKRVDYFKEMEAKKNSGELEKYTKKERIKINKELDSLKTKFEGIKNMVKLPEAVIIFDLRKDDTCAREAKRKNIPIVGIVDTNIDPALADHLIPANDDAISSIAYILDKIKEAIVNSK